MAVGDVWGNAWGSSWGVSWAAASVPIADEYAQKGWPARDFYIPYWMGLAPPEEVRRAAEIRIREERRRFGLLPPEAEAIIGPLATHQAEIDGDEIEQLSALLHEFDAARIRWRDHYGGHLRALREELREAWKAKKAAEFIADETKKATDAGKAREELATALQRRRRHIASLERAERYRRRASLLLLMSVA